jgi:hypothetical protein
MPQLKIPLHQDASREHFFDTDAVATSNRMEKILKVSASKWAPSPSFGHFWRQVPFDARIISTNNLQLIFFIFSWNLGGFFSKRPITFAIFAFSVTVLEGIEIWTISKLQPNYTRRLTATLKLFDAITAELKISRTNLDLSTATPTNCYKALPN